MTRIVGAMLRQFGPSAGAPAAPTLAVTDAGDGTGGTATITGADSDAAVTVYSQAVDGQLGTSAWTSQGSRTGNGTVSLSMDPGYYWFRAVAAKDGGTSASNNVYQHLTDGEDAVFYRALVAVQAVIQGLSLAGFASEDVRVRKLPWNRNAVTTEPGIFICPAREAMPPADGTNGFDYVTYAIQVVLVKASNQDIALSATWLNWREQIAQALRTRPLVGVNEVFHCWIEPGDVFNVPAFMAQHDVQALIVRCQSKELIT